jgi:hypothetical protein
MSVRSHRKKTSLLFHEIGVYRPLTEVHKIGVYRPLTEVHNIMNCSLFVIGAELGLRLRVLTGGGKNWQNNRENYIMRRFMICGLTGDHMKDDEIGGVHSTHVTTKGKIPLQRHKHTWCNPKVPEI